MSLIELSLCTFFSLSVSKLLIFFKSLVLSLLHTALNFKARVHLEDAWFIVWALTADGKQRLSKAETLLSAPCRKSSPCKGQKALRRSNS